MHDLRAAELREEADGFRESHEQPHVPGRLRGRLGWLLVELGLRLVHRPPVRTARIA